MYDLTHQSTGQVALSKYVEVCARLVSYQCRGPIFHVRGTVGEHCDVKGKAAGVDVMMLAPRHVMYLGPL